MSVNLLSFEINGIPIDELEAVKNDESVFEMPLEFVSTYPPLSEAFIDNPNKHIRTQQGRHYPRDNVYCSKGNTNVDSNVSDGFNEVRRKELSENSSKTGIQINPTLTKDIIEKKIRLKSFSEYPRKKDMGPVDKPFHVWKEDRKVNLILDDTYSATNVNRGRSAVSFNEEIVIGKFFISYKIFMRLLFF